MTLPATIASRAASLQALYIGSLELCALPDAIGQLEVLVHLDLRLPALTALPRRQQGDR